mmetsp:Transcript_4287/g.5723  ORF Transcript_4287/g.5723 Transcript_4287/m.5723 type:complete len:111 (+) Transcript_4287:34-366(+)|eukprot:Macronucleus_8908.p1 GENE.Macronucleus_8908~~Macronucleus_8908.p1  ORF type:complete len:111 (+),score=29.47 Macronucleus_8908:1-333(+)
MSRAFFLIGGAMVGTALVGKSAIYVYRAVKSGSAVSGAAKVGSYYKGGFEKAMTRREAALILGIRESSEEPKILAAHRKMMFNNHPDNGGSTFLATKVNEAKEMLVSNKQ